MKYVDKALENLSSENEKRYCDVAKGNPFLRQIDLDLEDILLHGLQVAGFLCYHRLQCSSICWLIEFQRVFLL